MGNLIGSHHHKDEVVVKIQPEDRLIVGGVASGKKPKDTVFRRSHLELMNLLLPVWYTTDPLTTEEIHLAKESWNLILNDTSEEFHRLKGTEGFIYSSAVVWFFDTFYNRFFDVHPTVKPLFKNGLVTQGRFLVKMISLLLSEITDNDKFDTALYKLVVTHNARGVKASEYGLVGEITFYSIRKCIGPSYTVAVGKAWVKVFSRMLKTIVPKAIALEISTEGGNQSERFKEYDENELQSERLETERRRELVEFSREAVKCPFTHEST